MSNGFPPEYDGLEEPSSKLGACKPLFERASHPAFAAFYRLYFRKLTAGLRAAYGAGPPDPDDVAQAAFEKLNARETLEDIKDLESYVWITARNIIMSAKRAERVRRNNEEDLKLHIFTSLSEHSDPENVLIAREGLCVIAEALKTMPKRRREIFMLHRVQGLSIAEAGRQCGIGRAAAHRHIGLAVRDIAEALEAGMVQTVCQEAAE